jgi:hypothetical protein
MVHVIFIFIINVSFSLLDTNEGADLSFHIHSKRERTACFGLRINVNVQVPRHYI